MQSIQFKRTQTAGKNQRRNNYHRVKSPVQLADHVIYQRQNNSIVQISVSPEKHAELNTKVDQ